jgi:UV excision repair protein RAD23
MIQLRQLVQQNPNLLQPFLQQLGQSNPNLLTQLTSNPTLLMSFLAEGAEGLDDDPSLPPGMMGGAGAGGPEDQTQYVQVSQEERDAIERLVGLGFERQLVVQAYFACDKNEEMAANYLIGKSPPRPNPSSTICPSIHLRPGELINFEWIALVLFC